MSKTTDDVREIKSEPNEQSKELRAMPFDKLESSEELWAKRRDAIQKSLRSISIAELKELAREHQEEFAGTPWRDQFEQLATEQPHASFYHAVAQPEAEVLYCRDIDFGFWIVPGNGSGPLDEHGKRLMREAIANNT